MHQDAEISISKYARICSTKYAKYAQMKCAKYMCYMLVYTKYANPKYAFICKYPYAYICRKYVEICKLNMHKYAFLKYA